MKYLVFDVGGSAIKYSLMNDELEMLEKGSEKTPLDSLENFKQVIKRVYEKYKGQIDGIAMSLPGLINRKTNRMQIPGALEYNFGVDILSELKSVTTDRFTIENDAKCAALCEVTYGSLKGTSVGAVCIIGTGIGGGVTIGDNVLTGSNGFAGEFSYFSTNWRDYEGFNSKWAVENSAFTLVAMIAQAKGLKAEDLDGIKAFEFCNNGDKAALKALSDYCDIVAMGLWNIQATVDPEKIAIGGGISRQPILMEYINKSLEKVYSKMPIPIPRVQIVNCKFFNDSNLIGALANYKKVYK